MLRNHRSARWALAAPPTWALAAPSTWALAAPPTWALAGALAWTAATPVTAHPQLPPELAGFDRYVESAMADWQVPGLSLAIVRDDAVVHARGYGTRTLSQDEPVDENTIFAIGSATKPFTTAVLGMLVDEGKVDWDAPVTEYLPWFRTADPWITRELTIRDLVTHRSGLPGGRANLLWYASKYDRREIVRRIRYLEPTASLRAEYQYQNLMFLTAGLVVEAVAGTSWDDFVRTRILEPLGMAATVTSVEPLPSRPNVASPHATIDGSMRPLPWRNVDNVAPAGSINSSARDMVQWIRLHLGEGAVNGRRILSEAQTLEMRTPQFVVDPARAGSMNVLNRAGSGINFFTYGLAWQVFDYRGRKVMWHGGNIDGMAAVVAMMPQEELGLVVLTNRNGGTLRDALMMRVFDAFLGGPPRDWSRELLNVEEEMDREGAAGRRGQEQTPVPEGPPTHPLERYAGTYEDALIGRAYVTEAAGRLALELETGLAGRLTHWHHDVFRVVFDDIGLQATFGALQGAPVVFRSGAVGGPVEMDVQGVGRFVR